MFKPGVLSDESIKKEFSAFFPNYKKEKFAKIPFYTLYNEAMTTPTKVGTSITARELVEKYNPSTLVPISLASTTTPPTPSPRNLNKKIEDFDKEQFRLDSLNPKVKLFLALMEDEIEPTGLVVMTKGKIYTDNRQNNLESVVAKAEQKFAGRKRIEELIEKSKLIAMAYDPNEQIDTEAESEVESVADIKEDLSNDDTKTPVRFYEEPTNDPRYNLVSSSPSPFRIAREERLMNILDKQIHPLFANMGGISPKLGPD